MTATPAWRRQTGMLAAVSGAILLIFRRDAADMVRIWLDTATFQHCVLIPPIIGWLAYQRAPALARIVPMAWLAGLGWLALGGLTWLLGDAGGLAVLRHGGLVVMLQGATVALLGRAATRLLLFPLGYAVFLIPVGSELEPWLQSVTTDIAMALLSAAGVPAHVEGVFITTPTGYFRVAEACSGARFLIPMAALAVLVCGLCFRCWLRRSAFLLAALVSCVLANGVRAFATIYVAHRSGADAAAGFDHILYGWLFFAIVTLLIIGAAWPFFDRAPADRDRLPPVRRVAVVSKPAWGIALSALAIAAAAPAWSGIARSRLTSVVSPRLPDVAGWRRMDEASNWRPHFRGARIVQASYADADGRRVDLAIAAFPRQSEGAELVGFGQGAISPGGIWQWSSAAAAPSGARGEMIAAPGQRQRLVISFYRVGDSALTGSPARVKLDTMKARLLGRDQRAVAILVSAEQSDGAPASVATARFLAAIGGADKVADALLATR